MDARTLVGHTGTGPAPIVLESSARAPEGLESPRTGPGTGRWPFRAPPKYQLLRLLGAGGMGSVLLARDRLLGRLVAIKFLNERCDLFLGRLRREARLMARLEHPSIVKVHELDELDGRLHLAMEYLDGGNLSQARLTPLELARTLRGVVDALGHAHAHGIVHRDVKPENVLLDRAGRARLSDFGLALDPDEGVGRRDGRPIVGTPLSMSPEQARGDLVGPASDTFSLGVLLFRQLARRWPFRGRTAADVLRAIERAPTPDLRELAPDVPRRLARAVERCLEKDPSARFASMAELGAELDAVLARRSLFSRTTAWLGARLDRRPRGLRIHPEELR